MRISFCVSNYFTDIDSLLQTVETKHMVKLRASKIDDTVNGYVTIRPRPEGEKMGFCESCGLDLRTVLEAHSSIEITFYVADSMPILIKDKLGKPILDNRGLEMVQNHRTTLIKKLVPVEDLKKTLTDFCLQNNLKMTEIAK